MVQRQCVIPGVAVVSFVVMALSLTRTTTAISAFVPPMVTSPRRIVQIKAMVDPSHAFHAQAHVEALLSTLYADVLKPAQEHTQPLWGPPDPILSAMTSIVPSPNAFNDAGLTAVPPTVDIPEKITETLMKTKGMNVIDPRSVIQFDRTLPGFQPTGHILPTHSAVQDSPQSLILEMGSIAKMMRVVNNLPMAAFLYTCVEFFLVKPGYDVYKEELEEDRPGAAVEFLMLSGLRLGILSVIGLFTLGLFDK